MPYFFQQKRSSQWEMVDDRQEERWLEAVYSNTALVTVLGDGGPISSSSQPSLMIRMLEALDVRPGNRVLEIGTGTGYNAALLSARLGDADVYSVDVDGGLIALARDRLAEIGLEPTLRAVDGEEGLPEFAPYDRIIATCSVPVVPWAWAEQLTPGGLVLVDVKRGGFGGNLVLLRRVVDGLMGRFLPDWATFMPMRHEGRPASAVPGATNTEVAETVTELDPEPWTNQVPWFLAQLTSSQPMSHGYVLDAVRGVPTHARLTALDGSWCTVSLRLEGHTHVVRQAGPLRLWDLVKAAHEQWIALDRPQWTRLGLTVERDRQWIWVDAPENAVARLGHAADPDVEVGSPASTPRR